MNWKMESEMDKNGGRKEDDDRKRVHININSLFITVLGCYSNSVTFGSN